MDWDCRHIRQLCSLLPVCSGLLSLLDHELETHPQHSCYLDYYYLLLVCGLRELDGQVVFDLSREVAGKILPLNSKECKTLKQDIELRMQLNLHNTSMQQNIYTTSFTSKTEE